MRALRKKILIFVAGLICGCQSQPVSTKSPLAGATPAPVPAVTLTLRPFPRDLIQEYLKKSRERFPGSVGLVVIPVGEPQARVEVQADHSFESASLAKLPILLTLAQQLESGEWTPDHALTFEERFRTGGSGLLQEREAGGEYSVDQLARWMIQESDNIASDMLWEALGEQRVAACLSRFGFKQTRVQRSMFDFAAIEEGRDNLTTAGDMAALLLATARGELPRSHWMREILMGTRRKDLIPAGLPASLRVAHKTGELNGILHDAAFFGQPEVVLVLMTEGCEKEVARDWMVETTRGFWQILGQS